MRTTCRCVLAIAMLLALALPAFAGDKEDLEARIIKYYQAWTGKQLDDYISSFAVGFTFAGSPGGVFGEPLTDTGLATFRATTDSLWRNTKQAANLTPRYITVNIYGNGTVGVAHYYRLGSTTNPAGTTTQRSERVTDVWVKDKGQWRAVHRHISPWRIGQTTP